MNDEIYISDFVAVTSNGSSVNIALGADRNGTEDENDPVLCGGHIDEWDGIARGCDKLPIPSVCLDRDSAIELVHNILHVIYGES